MIKITLPKFNNTQKPVKIGRNCLRNKRLIVSKKKKTFFRRHVNLHGGSVDGRNPVECANLANRGINYLSPGARFLPSTVSPNTKPIRKQHEVKKNDPVERLKKGSMTNLHKFIKTEGLRPV